MNLTRDVLIFIECILCVLVIALVVFQKSTEVEPMISNGAKSSINRTDNLLLNLTKILITAFFINTILLTYWNHSIKKESKISIIK